MRLLQDKLYAAPICQGFKLKRKPLQTYFHSYVGTGGTIRSRF